MRSISDIKLEINEISDRLKSISTELENLSNKDNVKSKVDFNFDNIRLHAKAQPIKGHHVEKIDEYSQKLYYTILLSAVGINEDDIEEKLKFIQRIICGGNLNINILEVQKQSLQIDEKTIDEFINILKENDLAINFAVDILILSNISGKCSDKVIEYITNLFNVVGLSREYVKFAVKMSKAIILQDKSLYEDILIEPLIKIDLSRFKMYTKNISSGRYKAYILENSSNKIVISSKNPVVYECNLEQLLKGKNDITLENLIINIDAATALEFKDFFNITFRNCKFIGDGSDKYITINFNEGNSVDIENCEFNNIKTPKIIFDNALSEIVVESMRGIEGQKLIYINNIKKINIINNIMTMCNIYGTSKAEYYENYSNNYIIYVINNQSKSINVKDNNFINCKGNEIKQINLS